jgi:N-acetylglucosaminyldiphosphoundecaprenol N-acetyl-beta-D-mannosaminyltransferase
LPNLTISGALSPPFRELSSEEKREIIDQITASSPHLVVIALGCPKQELWMYENTSSIQAPLLGIGAALPVYAGVEKRAPQWMQEHCLEWLYRLVQNPRRLLKRYFVTNSLFLLLLSWQFLSQKLAGKNPFIRS